MVHITLEKGENNKINFLDITTENKHAFAPVEDIKDTVHITNKGKMMDTLERIWMFFRPCIIV